MKSFLTLFSVVFFLLIAFACDAQKFIQLELPGDPIANKYFEGSSFAYQVSDYPGEYFNKVIKKIDIENEILVFEDGYIEVADITHIRRYRPWAKALGYSLSTFGAVWLTYGGIAHVFADDDNIGNEGTRFGWDTAIIGGTAILTGWIMRKWLYKKDYKLGKHARLRMLDITMPTSEEIYGPKG